MSATPIPFYNVCFLQNKQIIVGVTGGIAAYKSADLVRWLRKLGAMVHVVKSGIDAEKYANPRQSTSFTEEREAYFWSWRGQSCNGQGEG